MEASSALDPYAVLGLCAGASVVEVRAAYRRYALLTHPDKGGSKEAFQAVVNAFEVLSSLSAIPDNNLQQHRRAAETSSAARSAKVRRRTKNGPCHSEPHTDCRGSTAKTSSPDANGRAEASSTGAAHQQPRRHTPTIDEVLAALFTALQDLLSNQRKDIFDKLMNHQQRCALEQWIVRQRASGCKSAFSGSELLVAVPSAVDSLSSSSGTTSDSASRLFAICDCDDLPNADESEAPGNGTSQDDDYCTRASSPGVHDHVASRTRGVCNDGTGKWYAMTSFSLIIMKGDTRKDLGDAVSDHIAMMFVKQRVRELQAAPEHTFDDKIRQALTEVEASGVSCKSSSWRFGIEMRVRHFIGSTLRTPMVGLGEALRIRRMVVEIAPWHEALRPGQAAFLYKANLTPDAADAIWSKLRKIYIQISRDPDETDARLCRREQRNRDAKARYIKRWEQALERRAQRQRAQAGDCTAALGHPEVCKLVKALARAMRRADRMQRVNEHQARMDERRQRLDIQARRRETAKRLREEKHLTMDEILRR